jgi:hypothetical protein
MMLPPGATYSSITKQHFLYISFFVFLYLKEEKYFLDGVFKY